MPRETTGTELSSSAAPLSSGFPSIRKCNRPVLLPRHGPLGTRTGLGCSPFARHYWGNHCCFLFLGVLRCFSSPRSPPYSISTGDRPPGGRVVPFGNPRIKGHLRLPAAYRSLSRPSSQGIRHAPFPTFIDNAAPGGRRALILSVAPNYQGAGKTYVSFLLQSCLYNMSKIDTGPPAARARRPLGGE